MIPWWNIAIDEESALAVAEAVRQRRITCGPLVEEFERKVCEKIGVTHAIATSSGSAALTLALMEAGVGPGDEVIVPNRTWIATAHAAHTLGATVILADVEEKRPLMSVEAFQKALTARTKAVVPTHLNGHACDMDAIVDIAAQHGVLVVEDACQAFACTAPGTQRPLGSLGHSGCFSFTLAKCITTGQGGMVVTEDANVARRLRLMRTQGTASVLHAQWELPGNNFRMLDIVASLGLSQLDALPQRLQAFEKIYARYAEVLEPMRSLHLLPPPHPGAVPLYIEVLCPNRQEFMEHLAANAIEARAMYPDLHTAPHFAAANKGSYPHSRRFAEHCLILPSGPHRHEDELTAIFAALRQWETLHGK